MATMNQRTADGLQQRNKFLIEEDIAKPAPVFKTAKMKDDNLQRLNKYDEDLVFILHEAGGYTEEEAEYIVSLIKGRVQYYSDWLVYKRGREAANEYIKEIDERPTLDDEGWDLNKLNQN